MTTSPASRAGGTTKLVPCTTSISPVHHSIGGWSHRNHAHRKGRAAIGLRAGRTPRGVICDTSARPRHVMA